MTKFSLNPEKKNTKLLNKSFFFFFLILKQMKRCIVFYLFFGLCNTPAWAKRLILMCVSVCVYKNKKIINERKFMFRI